LNDESLAQVVYQEKNKQPDESFQELLELLAVYV
jgi:hypothetical protein